MLEAVERSIVQPLAPGDPLSAADLSLMDDLGKQLDAVERNIQGMGFVDSGLRTGSSGPVEAQLPDDEQALPSEPQQQGVQPVPPTGLDAAALAVPPLFSRGSRTMNNPSPRQHGLGGGGLAGARGQDPHPRVRAPLGGSGTGVAGRNSSLSVCPERHELIYKPDDCGSCPKYRHWPDETDEEPKECWYDWDVTQWLEEDERASVGDDENP